MNHVPESPHLLVMTSLENQEDAKVLVRELVASHIVACGTVLPPATSIYRWEGRVVEAGESVVLLKTHRSRWDELTWAVEELHPYDVPELLAFPVDSGLASYLHWLEAETAQVEAE
ncbi:MAG: divalent-cation tolerance protein CutA [Gemmatimonadales bacterium]